MRASTGNRTRAARDLRHTWQASILPLNHRCSHLSITHYILKISSYYFFILYNYSILNKYNYIIISLLPNRRGSISMPSPIPCMTKKNIDWQLENLLKYTCLTATFATRREIVLNKAPLSLGGLRVYTICLTDCCAWHKQLPVGVSLLL